MAPGDRHERTTVTGTGADAAYHLLLLCQNLQGYQNLLKLSSIAYREGFYYKPRIDKAVLKELSAGLGLNNSAITTLVIRMEEAGLLTRESCSIDGRSYRIYLTKKAKSIGQKAIPMTKELNKRMTQGFTGKEIDTVIRFLDSITSIARDEWKME